MSRFLRWWFAFMAVCAIVLFALGYTLFGVALTCGTIYWFVRTWRRGRADT